MDAAVFVCFPVPCKQLEKIVPCIPPRNRAKHRPIEIPVYPVSVMQNMEKIIVPVHKKIRVQRGLKKHWATAVRKRPTANSDKPMA
jgi:hypothetical protein